MYRAIAPRRKSKMQTILNTESDLKDLDEYLAKAHAKKLLLVCDHSIHFLRLDEYFADLEKRKGIQVIRFEDFESNPAYESVVRGEKVLRESGCDMIAAVGGGSAIDVAKCIKLYKNLDSSINYLTQAVVPCDMPLLAVPTTAGTGSEATRYAVIYYGGEKQSITHESCIPTAVLFEPQVLKTLPEYQKKSTMLDALCHALESVWSVNSTPQSKQFSAQAIKLILENMQSYLCGDENTYPIMLKAANLAGKAINITQTTAGHAMCYKLTSLYGIAHGHAAALCVKSLFPYMIANTDKCIDPRGEGFLKNSFAEIANAMGCKTAQAAAEKFAQIVDYLALEVPKTNGASDIDILKTSVNPDRLKNNPVKLDVPIIEKLYKQILGE